MSKPRTGGRRGREEVQNRGESRKILACWDAWRIRKVQRLPPGLVRTDLMKLGTAITVAVVMVEVKGCGGEGSRLRGKVV